MKKLKYFSILLATILTILVVRTRAGCQECRSREKMCRPTIDWRENWINKEVPVPGIKIEYDEVRRSVPIPDVSISETEVMKPITVPVQSINVVREEVPVNKTVRMRQYKVVDREQEIYVDVPNIIEKVVKVPKKFKVIKKVFKVVPNVMMVDRTERRKRLRVEKRNVPKVVSVPEVMQEVVYNNKTIMVHETTYIFCRQEESAPEPCPPQVCTQCPKCRQCSGGYLYNTPRRF